MSLEEISYGHTNNQSIMAAMDPIMITAIAQSLMNFFLSSGLASLQSNNFYIHKYRITPLKPTLSISIKNY
jgi:hypothetical protein